MALLVAVLLLVGVGVAYAANSYPADYAALSEDHLGRVDSLLAEGLDGLLRGWLGDDEDPGEPPD